MASEEISSVPTIDTDLLKRAGIAVRGLKFSLFTNLSEGDEEELNLNANNIWTDKNELWSPEKHNLRIRGELVVTDERQLYGVACRRGFSEKGCGIVAKDAELDFVLEWISSCHDTKTSAFSVSGCILPSVRRSYRGTGKLYVFEHTFIPGTIKGSLNLAIHAYVKRSAKIVSESERMFINEEGYLFSPPVDECKYPFQVDVVPFPIKEVSNPNKPLWWLQIRDMDDPSNEMFQESNVSICINRACAGFESLLLKKNRSTLIMVHTEVVATAYFLLVRYLKNHKESKSYWGKMMSGEGLERNTIPEVIGKFLRESEIKTEGVSDEYLYQRISEEMQKRLAE